MTAKSRIILIILALTLAVPPLSAQVSVRLDYCENYFSRGGYDPGASDRDLGWGFRFGADYDFRLKNDFYLTLGVNITKRSARFTSESAGVKRTERLDELLTPQFPIHLKWRHDFGNRCGLYVYGGISLCAAEISKSYIDIRGYGERITAVFENPDGSANYDLSEYQRGRSPEFDNYMKSRLEHVGREFRTFEPRMEFGFAFVLDYHYEFVYGMDYAMRNKYHKRYGNSHFLACQTHFIGFHFRFGPKTAINWKSPYLYGNFRNRPSDGQEKPRRKTLRK